MDTTGTSRRSRMGTSRAGGGPTVLPDDQAVAYQQGAFELDRGAGGRQEVSPGVALIPGWLTHDEQQALVDQFREWARPPAGLRHPRVPSGHLMSVQSVC